MEKKRSILLLVILLSFSFFVFAETVVLKSGKEIEGKIVERTNDFIKIDVGVGIPITYFSEDIDKIESDSSEEISIPTGFSTTLEAQSPSASSGNNLYISKQYGFSIEIPAGWFVKSGEMEKKAALARKKNISYEDFIKKNPECAQVISEGVFYKIVDTFSERIVDIFILELAFYKFNPDTTPKKDNPFFEIKVEQKSKQEADMFFNLWISILSQVPGVKILEGPHEVEINSLYGKRIVFLQNKSTEFKYQLWKNGYMYHIYFLSNATYAKESLAEAEKAIKTFKLLQ